MSDFADLKLGGLIRTPTPQGLEVAATRGQHRPMPDLHLGRKRMDGPGIAGIVKVAGSPARRRVTLFDHRTLRPLARTWSDPETGDYGFNGLEAGNWYLVVCDDHRRQYNAAVADWVQAG